MIIAEEVQQVLGDCFCSEGTTEEEVKIMIDDGRCKIIEGITSIFALRVVKLKEYEERIREFLGEMSNTFFVEKGGGWSFLNMCIDRNGVQWGEHRDMEALLVLGIGIGCVKYSMPRNLWKLFPGGLPYIEIDLSKRML